MRTEVVTCEKCGSLYPSNAGEDHGHDLIPCPLCHLKWDIENKLNVEQTKRFEMFRAINERDARIAELEEKIKDLQDTIDDIAEELDEL